jgi:hypothetical protein
MTSSATMPDPFISVFVRSQVALLEKNKKKFSKRSEPNIGKLPGPPPDRSLGRKSVLAIGTQEVIENNTKRILPSRVNPGIQRHQHPAATLRLSQNVIPKAPSHHNTPTGRGFPPHRPLSRTMAFSPQSAEWSALCLIR